MLNRHKVVEKTAEALISTGLASLGYNYVNIDDCWQSDRDSATGEIQPDSTRFPSGIPALAAKVHALGLKFGLYSSAGTHTCEKRAGSLGHELSDAMTYASWDVDYIKLDNCFEGELNDYAGNVARYSAMRDALAEAGRPMVYSICNWGFAEVWKWAGDVGNSWRTTGDICDHFEGSWCSAMAILDMNVDLTRYPRPGGFNDLDMLEVGNGGMTPTQYRTHFSAWAALKSPLILGNDLTNMTSETLSILSNADVIAINQDALGLSAHLVRRSGGADVWAGMLANGDRVVLVINRSKKDLPAGSVLVDYTLFGGAAQNAKIEVHDLWTKERRILGDNGGSIKIGAMPADGCAMYRVKSLGGPFAKVEMRAPGTFPLRTWWWALVSFVRWYKTRNARELDMVHGGAATVVFAVLLFGLLTLMGRVKGAKKDKKD
ncbi:hypothetical protein HK101_002760 [Irineochytrium annulatum]|nr:hypothetical protein HK101_002760 [Irineochytrium annulatum]